MESMAYDLVYDIPSGCSGLAARAARRLTQLPLAYLVEMCY
jgi:hypothetical protein